MKLTHSLVNKPVYHNLNINPIFDSFSFKLDSIQVYSIKVAIRGISPMVWRRFQLSDKTSLADLHHGKKKMATQF